ncbi:MAG: class I SAM-dependent methyltransferase [Chloracidobacterium sp.]|uniref:Class I SAM-dependent methyltransferase n=1 Tax=Chloracidobacterium validum TaxID=2821543 RepID=A0ABX8BI19_9BACT|nr:class I SAM-dependent methyltransferase [Chloracidobacterium validum]QUW04695.1 class I SAM-dependent methyltransferase [Chloracidobacterium validum]
MTQTPSPPPAAKAATDTDWFGTPYYALLYHHRDETEACLFIANLVRHLGLGPGDRVLDIGCGRGRHAICLHEHRLDVDAFDISPSCIAMAQPYANETLRFHVHDMRQPFADGGYRAAFNMFTSFGYFATDEENAQVVAAAAQALDPGGGFVLDFLNAHWVVPRLTPFSVQVVGGIRFEIRREYVDGFILKTIVFEDAGQRFCFVERVKDLRRPTLQAFFTAAGLRVDAVFGDYDLSAYTADASRRIILIGRKP